MASARRPGEPAGRPADVIGALIAAPLGAAGYDLESVAVTRAGQRYVVAVALDRDGGLDLDAVAEASRAVSDVLDAHDDVLPVALRDAYTLEVSSRGATAPLVLPRHWRRATGRLVEVRRRGGEAHQPSTLTGRVSGADDDGATLEVDGTEVRVGYDEVIRAAVQLEFRRPPGVAALDADDEPEEDEAP